MIHVEEPQTVLPEENISEPTVNTTVEEVIENTTLEPIVAPEEPKWTDTFNVILSDYDTTQRADDYMTMDEVTITVHNPHTYYNSYQVQFFLFGDNEDILIKGKPRDTFSFENVAPGEARQQTYKVRFGFNEIGKDKTVRLRLLDETKRVLEENNYAINFTE